MDCISNLKKNEPRISRGSPLPLGVTSKRDGFNFSIFSRYATSVTLLIFSDDGKEIREEIPLNPCIHRTGEVWHAFITGITPGANYAYKMDREFNENSEIHRFHRDLTLIDPYAKALSGSGEWCKPEESREAGHSINLKRCVVVDDEYDWDDDRPLNIPLKDSIIYEFHLRGFSCHSSAGVQHGGTYLGLTEKIPYLKELGVTAIELLPITEFDELENMRTNPNTGEKLRNYWGYDPINFFSPKAAFAADSKGDNHVREFKSMVKALHKAGIEVILDVVFNHTAESDERGPVFSFKGIDNSTYYIIEPTSGKYHNYSGCGNTLNCNHPVVRNMIIDCLRYWVTEMHVDGFRFDLASILGRGRDGSVLPNPPLLERIAADPVLANTKLIAEAWDAAGLYQVGTFPNWGRWAEWNGKFRDDIRRFVRGEKGLVSSLATRLTGSSDLYQHSGRAPYHSINFITSHDGFTLADLVTYSKKRNLDNGEDNKDGMNENFSWNCGHEGPTDSEEIKSLRNQQIKNFAVLLLLSHGVPMILSGDEFGRTQKGNNNAYCQDNEISWLDWSLKEKNKDIFRFFKILIAFRKRHETLRRECFEECSGNIADTIAWHGVKCNSPDWSFESRTLAVQFAGGESGNDIFIICNCYWEKLKFELPKLNGDRKWYRFVDTSLSSPNDIAEIDKEVTLRGQRFYNVSPRSTVVLIAKKRKLSER